MSRWQSALDKDTRDRQDKLRRRRVNIVIDKDPKPEDKDDVKDNRDIKRFGVHRLSELTEVAPSDCMFVAPLGDEKLIHKRIKPRGKDEKIVPTYKQTMRGRIMLRKQDKLCIRLDKRYILKLKPIYAPKPEKADAEGEAKAEAEPEPEAKPEPEPEAKPKPEAEAEAKDGVEAKGEAKAVQEEAKIERYTGEFSLTADWTPVSERKQRIERGLERFRRMQCSLYVHKSLMGCHDDNANIKHRKSKWLPINTKSPSKAMVLDAYQKQAVETAMCKRVALIEGPSGSGKTVVAAHLAMSMARLHSYKVLVCCPHERSIEQLVRIIDRSESLEAVMLRSTLGEERRRGARRQFTRRMRNRRRVFECEADQKTMASEETYDCDLDALIDAQIGEQCRSNFIRTLGISREALEIRETIVGLEMQAERQIEASSDWLRDKWQRDILRKADIVCCTPLEAGGERLRNVRFDMVIVDDADDCSELECIVPIAMDHVKQVTLIADLRRQMYRRQCAGMKSENLRFESAALTASKAKVSPVGSDVDALQRARKMKRLQHKVSEPGSLFERWLNEGLTSSPLKHQHRMHPKLYSIVHDMFYKTKSSSRRDSTDVDELQPENSVATDKHFAWLPDYSNPTCLIDVRAGLEGSLIDKVHDLVARVIGPKIRGRQIAVIANSSRHATQLFFGHQVPVFTVDELAGEERSFVILAATSGGHETTSRRIDFTRDDRALCKAMSRARRLLLVVADVEAAKQQRQTLGAKWLELIEYYESRGLVKQE